MNISIYQFILGALSLTFIVNAIMKFLKKESGQTLFKFISILAIWLGIFAFAIFPRLSRAISIMFGLGENLNTLIFIGFVTIFIIIFKLLNTMEKIERNISEIVRKEALSKLKNDES